MFCCSGNETRFGGKIQCSTAVNECWTEAERSRTTIPILVLIYVDLIVRPVIRENRYVNWLITAKRRPVARTSQRWTIM